MKIRSLLPVAGSLAFLTSPAPADFLGTYFEIQLHTQYTLSTGRVYALFSEPDDRVVAVAGTPGVPLHVGVGFGDGQLIFYQDPAGTDLPPLDFFIRIFPSLAFDTFVTIGKETSAGDATQLFPGWAGFGPSDLPPIGNPGTNVGWFTTPDEVQGLPDPEGRVLLGQFSAVLASNSELPHEFGHGRFLVQYESGGSAFQVSTGFCTSRIGGECEPFDWNADSVIDLEELLYLLECWGEIVDPDGYCGYWLDLDGDGYVGVIDLLIVLANWTIHQPVPEAAADLDGDGVVGDQDLLILLACAQVGGGRCDGADLDRDGDIDTTDLLVLLGNWGE